MTVAATNPRLLTATQAMSGPPSPCAPHKRTRPVWSLDDTAEASDDSPPTIPAGEVLELRFVYGTVFLPLDVFVYTGSTSRDGVLERTDEHRRLCGGARRLTIAFAQEQWQPTTDYFEFRELWRGECTLAQCRSIEQHFMDRNKTRVVLRPTNGVARDIDLMRPDAEPRQLNVLRACTDAALVQWARTRVASDTALVTRLTPSEREQARHAFSMVRLNLESTAGSVALVVARRVHHKYATLPGDADVSTTDAHADLNHILACLSADDGPRAQRGCRSKLFLFNVDHHGADATWRAAHVAAEFAAVLASLGAETVPLVCHGQLTPSTATSGNVPASADPAYHQAAQWLRANLTLVDNCHRCAVARDPANIAVRENFPSQSRQLKIACPLFAHCARGNDIAMALVGVTKGLGKTKARDYVSKFMTEEHKVEPLGTDRHKVRMYARRWIHNDPDEDLATVNDNGELTAIGHADPPAHYKVYAGFNLKLE